MPPIEKLQKIRMYKRYGDLAITDFLYMEEFIGSFVFGEKVKGLLFLKDLLKSSSLCGRNV